MNNAWKPQHPQVLVMMPSGEEVEVDVLIADLLIALWSKGCETLYSCQGNPCFADEGTSQTQAYILFPATPLNIALTTQFLHEFNVFIDEDRGPMEFEFSDRSEYGRRIVWRFPQHIIHELYDFVTYKFHSMVAMR